MDSATFEFASAVRLRVRGDRAAVSHFLREYGPCAVPGRDPVGAIVTIDRPSTATGLVIKGGHKTVRWRVALGDPATEPFALSITTLGWPSSFARSLVQGYFVEPLISIVAAHHGLVLVPAAAIAADNGLIVVLGRSRAGKSTLAARAIANGRSVLGDDQVFLDRAGGCWPFPRRLRFYPDLVETAPSAYAGLSSRSRRTLVARRWISALSRGWIRPSLAVDRAELGSSWTAASMPIQRLVLVERSTARDVRPRDALAVATADPAEGARWATELLQEQRAHFVEAAGPGWVPTMAQVRSTEAPILASAMTSTPIERITLPGTWDASTAVAAMARHLELET